MQYNLRYISVTLNCGFYFNAAVSITKLQNYALDLDAISELHYILSSIINT